MKYDAAYARQSLFKKDSLSISGQLDLCQKAADSDLKVYQDAGYSGKNTDRPDFKRLMKDIKADKIRKLYVYRLDRFSRSVADFGQLWDILQAHNVEFVSVNENFDTTTPMGRAMLHIIMVFAQLERETIAERVKDNYYRRASLGAWPGGPAPYGYTIGRANTADGRAVPTLVPDEQADIVRHIYEEYAQDDISLSKLARALSTQNIPGPKRATWDNVTLSRLLHNPTYVMADEQVRLHLLSQGCSVTSDADSFDGVHGVLLVGKRKSSTRKYTNNQEHSASVLNSVGIIPADLWLKCQMKLSHNQQVGNSGKGKYTWLSGLLKCAKCGYSLKIITEQSNRRMVCSGRYNLSACDISIRAKLSEIEDVISTEIEKLLTSCPTEESTDQDDRTYCSQLKELDRRADRLMSAFAESNDLSPVYLQRALKQIEQERERILEIQRRDYSRPALPKTIHFPSLNFEEKKAVAAQFIRRVEVSESGVNIIWAV